MKDWEHYLEWTFQVELFYLTNLITKLEKKVIEIMANYLGLKEEEITLDMDLMDDLNINSYDIMSIVGKFEDEFDIEVPDEDIRNFRTVADVINYIKKQN